MSIVLYCNCYKQKTPYRIQQNQKNLMLGSSQYTSKLKDELISEGYILDDIGDNISHLNKWFGQSCGLYWVYKNSNEDFVGMNTYRIFWNDSAISNLDVSENKLYVPSKFDVSDDGINYENLENHFRVSHGNGSYKMLMNCIKNNNILYTDFNNWMSQKFLYPFSIFIANKKIFDKICSILFELAFDFFDTNRYTIYNFSDHYGQIRQMDFICERILHLIFNNIDYFIPNIDITEIPIYQYKHI